MSYRDEPACPTGAGRVLKYGRCARLVRSLLNFAENDTMAIEFASTAIHEAVDTAEDKAATTLQKLREQTDAVVQRVRPQIDAVSDYVRNEPTKALLVSAATGAALMGLIALLTRSPSRSERLSGSAHSILSSVRDAAIDLADQAHAAIDTAAAATRKYAAQGQAFTDKGQKYAERANRLLARSQKKAAKAQQRAMTQAAAAQAQASSTMDTVSETVSDAWKSLRDQAGPVVDKLKPQIDAVTSYAKDEPARTALGVAVAGAVLLGLMALINRSED